MKRSIMAVLSLVIVLAIGFTFTACNIDLGTGGDDNKDHTQTEPGEEIPDGNVPGESTQGDADLAEAVRLVYASVTRDAEGMSFDAESSVDVDVTYDDGDTYREYIAGGFGAQALRNDKGNVLTSIYAYDEYGDIAADIERPDASELDRHYMLDGNELYVYDYATDGAGTDDAEGAPLYMPGYYTGNDQLTSFIFDGSFDELLAEYDIDIYSDWTFDELKQKIREMSVADAYEMARGIYIDVMNMLFYPGTDTPAYDYSTDMPALSETFLRFIDDVSLDDVLGVYDDIGDTYGLFTGERGLAIDFIDYIFDGCFGIEKISSDGKEELVITVDAGDRLEYFATSITQVFERETFTDNGMMKALFGIDLTAFYENLKDVFTPSITLEDAAALISDVTESVGVTAEDVLGVMGEVVGYLTGREKDLPAYYEDNKNKTLGEAFVDVFNIDYDRMEEVMEELIGLFNETGRNECVLLQTDITQIPIVGSFDISCTLRADITDGVFNGMTGDGEIEFTYHMCEDYDSYAVTESGTITLSGTASLEAGTEGIDLPVNVLYYYTPFFDIGQDELTAVLNGESDLIIDMPVAAFGDMDISLGEGSQMNIVYSMAVQGISGVSNVSDSIWLEGDDIREEDGKIVISSELFGEITGDVEYIRLEIKPSFDISCADGTFYDECDTGVFTSGNIYFA